MSEHNAYQPVVILGAPRSGTNLLRDGICAHRGVATWPCDEINLLWRTGNSGCNTDELVPSDARPEVRRRIRKAFDSIAIRYGASRVVEKTCANTLRVGFVDRVLPGARYISITRNGYDAVASAMKRWVSPVDWRYTLRKVRFCPTQDLPRYAVGFARNRLAKCGATDGRMRSWGPRFKGIDEAVRTQPLAEVCALQWRACVTATGQALAEIAPDRVHHIRYEQLVSNPQKTLEGVCRFLGVATDPIAIEGFSQSVFGGSVGAGLRSFSPEQLQSISPVIKSGEEAIGAVAHAA